MDTLESMYQGGLLKDYHVSRDESGLCVIGVSWMDYSKDPMGEEWTGCGNGATPEEALKDALRNHPVMERKAAA